MFIFVVNIRPARTFWNSTHCLLSPFTLDWSRNLWHNPMWNMDVNNISYPIYPLSKRTEKDYITKMIPFFFVQYINKFLLVMKVCRVVTWKCLCLYFQTVKQMMVIVCKCHGVSGSCSVKICWRKMGAFREIGQNLKQKFDGASQVKYSKRKHKLKRKTKDMKKPTKKDLVYLDESPDFCNYDLKSGSLGTKGRRCNKDSMGIDGCTLMCCGRGYKTIVRERNEDCDCKFVWCCRVDCKKCSMREEINYCN